MANSLIDVVLAVDASNAMIWLRKSVIAVVLAIEFCRAVIWVAKVWISVDFAAELFKAVIWVANSLIDVVKSEFVVVFGVEFRAKIWSRNDEMSDVL